VVRRGRVTWRWTAQSQGAKKDADRNAKHGELRAKRTIRGHQSNRDWSDEVPRIQLHSWVSEGMRAELQQAQREKEISTKVSEGKCV
jgi:hypothetical protein